MQYYTYSECKKYLQQFKIPSSYEFYRMLDNGSFNELVNRRPYEYYRTKKRNTWVSWSDFLSIDENKILENKYLGFIEAKNYVRKLGIKSQKDWSKYHRENNLSDLRIPSNPGIVYKNKGWLSLSDWLGNDSYINMSKIKYLTYDECVRYVKDNLPEVKSRSQWIKYEKSKLPISVPKRPDHIYKKTGDWVNWASFLDSPISTRSKSKLFLDFNDARDLVRELKLTQSYEYVDYLNKNNILNLPKRPSYVYRNSWNGYLDFLGCETNRKSYGEKKITEYLDINQIKYIREKKFESCKNINNLRFDFYIPSHNLCIEYDGELHYKIVSIFGGEDSYNKILENDGIKNKWCLENNIKIIRIPYKKKRKIDQILDGIFK